MSIPKLPEIDIKVFKFAAAVTVISLLVGGVIWWQGKPTQLEIELPAEVSTPELGTLFVHVTGKVINPGVFELPAGSRVIDAISAAGGVKPAAKVANLNLARVVFDGEQIIVDASTSTAAKVDDRISINSASANQLEALPGIGPVIANRIVEHRTSNGPFRQPTDIMQVSGIGDALFNKIKDKITI